MYVLVAAFSNDGLSETLNFEVCASRLLYQIAYVLLILIKPKLVDLKLYRRPILGKKFKAIESLLGRKTTVFNYILAPL